MGEEEALFARVSEHLTALAKETMTGLACLSWPEKEEWAAGAPLADSSSALRQRRYERYRQGSYEPGAFGMPIAQPYFSSDSDLDSAPAAAEEPHLVRPLRPPVKSSQSAYAAHELNNAVLCPIYAVSAVASSESVYACSELNDWALSPGLERLRLEAEWEATEEARLARLAPHRLLSYDPGAFGQPLLCRDPRRPRSPRSPRALTFPH